ncbi:hypothetical protein TNCV_144211 [Trichonephila clavipes]|nr:hypothetical protein TNCV_144211 [Trichonephila clavipes]
MTERVELLSPTIASLFLHVCTQSSPTKVVPGSINMELRADWERMVFSDESQFQLCPDDNRRCTGRLTRRCGDPALTFACHTDPQQSACPTLPWPARSLYLSPIQHLWTVVGRRLQPLRNDDSIAQLLVSTKFHRTRNFTGYATPFDSLHPG